MKTYYLSGFNKKSKFLMFVFLFSLGLCQAQNHITIASVGGERPRFENERSAQEIVDTYIEFWDARIKEVLPSQPDLIVLPEVFDHPSGLSAERKTEYYNIRENQVRDHLASVAKANNCYIAFGTRRYDQEGNLRNSCIVLDRTGETAGIYNKNFPTIEEMQEGIVAGTEIPIIECDFGRVAGVVCFDLNFMELMERYAAEKPDIILFPSMYHGGLKQGDWAYSCRSFFVSALGFDELTSEIRNPLGEVVASSTNYFHHVVTTVNLDSKLVHLDGNWQKLRTLKKKYGEAVTISDPGRLGAVMIASEKEGVSTIQMIKEFEIEQLDDYFERSRKFKLAQQKGGTD